MMRRLTNFWAAAGIVAALMASTAHVGATQPASASSPDSLRIGTFSGAFLAARMAENDNDVPAAISFYKRALAFSPDDRSLQQNLLLALIADGSFDEALTYAEQLQDVPEVERFSRLALAVDAIRDGEYEDAQDWLELTLESDLDRLITGIVGGWARLGAGDPDAAIAHIDGLNGPDWYGLFVGYHKAMIAERAGMVEEAAAFYRDTVDNVSSMGTAPEVYLRAIEAYAGFQARQGDGGVALETLARADDFATGRVTVEAMRAQIEAGEEPQPMAAGPVEGTAEALLNLATALNRGGGESFVRLYLHYALAATPDNDAVLVQLAGIAEQQRNAEAAISFYERIPDDSPAKRIAELQLGLNLADLDRHDEAIEHLQALLDDDPDDMRAYMALGGVYASQENFRAAADLYDIAVTRIDEPTRAEWNIYYQRGIAYERLKEWEKAEPNFKQALELFPDQPQVLNYLGYSWVDMNMNLDEGLDLIKKAVELRPSDGYIVDSLGWAYYRLERFEDAVRELERAVGLMPADPILNDHLGDAYWRVGRRLEASFQWSHARDLDPEPDVLAEVERKLRDGLPSVEEERAENEARQAELQEASAAGLVPIPVIEAPQSAEPVQDASAARAVHVVGPGQSLWAIAAEVLGDGNRFGEILELNPQLGDPGRLTPGQELMLPSR